MKLKVIASELPAHARELRRELQQHRADLEVKRSRIEELRARLWRYLQREFGLDLDGRQYRIDAAGQLVEIGDEQNQGGEESVAGMVAARYLSSRDDDPSLH